MNTTVYNLATGEELIYVGITPRDALISAAILHNREANNLTNPLTRDRYEKRIITGRYGISIDDLAVKI